jgi:hypothetical protein
LDVITTGATHQSDSSNSAPMAAQGFMMISDWLEHSVVVGQQ